jgi:16S rRNA (guanine966-N2)-methyltransferase
MRIIAGVRRGRKLAYHPDLPVKPLPDRLKESLFNILAPAIPGARVLDTYAGVGSFGLEALSRGAVHATFVENGAAVLPFLRRNIEGAGFKPAAYVAAEDVFTFLRRPHRGEPYTLAFFDPPFAAVEQGRFFPDLEGVAAGLALADRGLLIVRLPSTVPSPAAAAGRPLVDERTYGRSRVAFYQKGSP